MKKIILLLSLAFILISACMIYLVKVGVSLRSAPIIGVSTISSDFQNIADGVVFRLSPEFQNAHYILWGFLPFSADSEKVFNQLKLEYEKIFKKKIHLVVLAENASLEELQTCQSPCWLLLPADKSNELAENDFIQKRLQPLGRDYFNVTWMPFSKLEEVPNYCIEEKRLTLECLKVLAIQEMQKKMKPGARHFFMKKYNQKDFFLFFQTAH